MENSSPVTYATVYAKMSPALGSVKTSAPLAAGTIVQVNLTGELLALLKPCDHLPRDPSKEFSGQKYLARTTDHAKTPITECEFKVIAAPNNERSGELLAPGTTVKVNLTGELLAILGPCFHEESDPEFRYTGQKYVARTADRKKKTVMACEISVHSDTSKVTGHTPGHTKQGR